MWHDMIGISPQEQFVHSVDKLRKVGTALIVMLLAYASAGYGTTLSYSLMPTPDPIGI